MSKSLFAAALAVGMLVGLSGCPQAPQCAVDTDCAAGFTCAAGDCVAAVVDGGSGGGGGGGGDLDAGQDAGAGGDGGQLVTVGEQCTDAEPLASGPGFQTSTAAFENDFEFTEGGGCKRTDSAPDRVYRVEVPAGQRLLVSFESTWDAVLNLVDGPAESCPVGPPGGTAVPSCLASSDRGLGGTETVSWTNLGTTSRTIFLVLDGFLSQQAGEGQLTVSLTPPPAGDICATAQVLSLPAQLTRQSIDDFRLDQSSASQGCGPSNAVADRYFRATVPPGQRLRVEAKAEATADAGAPSPDLALALLIGACTIPESCAAFAGTLGSSGRVLTWDNFGSSAAEVTVRVSRTLPGSPLTFSLDATVAATPVVQAGEVCDNIAAPITATTTLSAKFDGYVNDYTFAEQSGCEYWSGPDRAWAVVIPPGQSMSATATPHAGDAGIRVSLSLVAEGLQCGAGPCLASSPLLGPGVKRVQTSNAGATARTVRIVADTEEQTPSGGFDLAVAFAATPAADVCETATPALSAPVTLPAESLATFTKDYDFSLQGGCRIARGSDRAYAIDIPANQVLRATATPLDGGMLDVTLNLVDGPASNCSAPAVQCLASTDARGVNGPETLMGSNPGTSPRRVYLVVSDFGSGGSGWGEYQLQVDFTPRLAGDGCTDASLLTPPVTLSAESLVGYQPDLATAQACTGYSNTGPEKVYRVTVGAGQTLSATVTPTAGNWDAAIYLVPTTTGACSATASTCLAGRDVGTQGAAETVSWKNTAASAQDVFVVVDSLNLSAIGSYGLSVSLQ